MVYNKNYSGKLTIKVGEVYSTILIITDYSDVYIFFYRL